MWVVRMNLAISHRPKMGIMTFENDQWKSLPSGNLTNVEVTAILPIKNAIIVTTLKNGVYHYSNTGATKIVSPATGAIEKERVYTATAINNEWIGLGTTNGGVYIIDEKGNLIQNLSKQEGLQNYNIISIFCDNQSNLWLGLNNGIDCIGFNKAIKLINPNYQDASAYATIIYKDNLYVGTSSGLYSAPLHGASDLSFNRGNFTAIKNSAGQVWGLANINDKLLLAHHEGAFQIQQNEARLISNKTGFWNFQTISTTGSESKIVAGNYIGLLYLNDNGNNLATTNGVKNFTQSSRFVAVDEEAHIWVSHPFHGLYRVEKDTTSKMAPKLYTDKNGLPSSLNNHVYNCLLYTSDAADE